MIRATSRTSSLAFVLSAALLLGCGDDPTSSRPRRLFDAQVSGDLSRDLSGPAAFGETTIGDDEVPAFGVVLGGEELDDVIGLVKAGGARPATGSYEVVLAVDEPPPAGKWAAAYSFVDGDQVGFFVATGGEVQITTSNDDRVAGTFDLEGEGFLAEDPETPVAVSISGSFDAGRQAGSASMLRLRVQRPPALR